MMNDGSLEYTVVRRLGVEFGSDGGRRKGVELAAQSTISYGIACRRSFFGRYFQTIPRQAI